MDTDEDVDVDSDRLTQLYFWGGHGGIGGGDARQLESSNCTIRFLVEEMERREIGLAMNMDMIPEYGDVEKTGEKLASSRIMSFVEKLTGKFVRPIESVDQLHKLAIRRYQRCPDWRPVALKNLHDDIMAKDVDAEEE